MGISFHGGYGSTTMGLAVLVGIVDMDATVTKNKGRIKESVTATIPPASGVLLFEMSPENVPVVTR